MRLTLIVLNILYRIHNKNGHKSNQIDGNTSKFSNKGNLKLFSLTKSINFP